MRWLSALVAEVIGLFVDDGAFALALVGWLVIVWLVLPQIGLSATLHGLILFAGLAVILTASAARASKR